MSYPKPFDGLIGDQQTRKTFGKAIIGTASCQVLHFGYVISGRMEVVMDDVKEYELGSGDIVVISPSQGAWVIGDDLYVGLDFQGGKTYAK